MAITYSLLLNNRSCFITWRSKITLFIYTFRVSLFYSETALRDLLNQLSKPHAMTGLGIMVGGLNNLIKKARENWRKTVDKYVKEVADFARTIELPTVVIQLPFRNDSSSILRVQREQVWLGKISKIFIFLINGKLLRYSFSLDKEILLKFFASLPWDEILKTSYANSYYFL